MSALLAWLRKIHYPSVVVGVAAVLVGAVVLRLFTLTPHTTHYHANFALYINGQRDEFKSFTFYEEVQSCAGHDTNNPKIRVHLHDQKNDVVHVHDAAVTWGHFFANLGYSLGDTFIKTDAGYDAISKTASHYNATADPAACSGHEDRGFTDRLKDAVQLWD
jgi:hypothetical protein